MDKKLKEPLHILVDGPDKLGKSTVIQLLSRELNLPVIKMPDSDKFIKDHSIERVSKFYNEILIQFQESSFIMDRGYISSQVFSEVFHRDEPLNYIENIAGILKPKVFIFTGLQKGLDDLEEVNNSWNKINQKFLDYAHDYEYTVINVEGLTPIQICNKILESL